MRYFFLFKQGCYLAYFFSTIPVELFFCKIFNGFLHHVCRVKDRKWFIMDFYHKADDFVLLDLLAEHTNRLTQMMIYGETYKGEYSAARQTVELLQDEIITRRGFYVGAVSYSKIHNQSPAAWHAR